MSPLLRLRAALRLSALAVPLALAACVATDPLPAPESPRQLAVERVERTHTVYFATDVDQPSAEEKRRLASFLGGLDPEQRRTFRVSGHADDRASESYNVDLSARRARGVGGLIRGWGFAGDDIVTTAFGEKAPAQPGQTDAARAGNRRVDVVVDGWTVVLSGCPDWSRDPADTALNYPLGNQGCATLATLARMVADPADLARGRALGPADAVREAEAVVRYRTDKVKDLQDELTSP
ncbi:MAG TPA: CpaD family pilus assembly lipoprotein [Geminicoccaceae bacterium]|nr:CpaD family pilus assembly lipoprotein [Geminicoccus sp.]HMU50032.1 CpaD family pilus assembly lipoprotein [Geminicoccaceae bacterium]